MTTVAAPWCYASSRQIRPRNCQYDWYTSYYYCLLSSARGRRNPPRWLAADEAAATAWQWCRQALDHTGYSSPYTTDHTHSRLDHTIHTIVFLCIHLWTNRLTNVFSLQLCIITCSATNPQIVTKVIRSPLFSHLCTQHLSSGVLECDCHVYGPVFRRKFCQIP